MHFTTPKHHFILQWRLAAHSLPPSDAPISRNSRTSTHTAQIQFLSLKSFQNAFPFTTSIIRQSNVNPILFNINLKVKLQLLNVIRASILTDLKIPNFSQP